MADVHRSSTDDDIHARLPLALDRVLLHREEIGYDSEKISDALGRAITEGGAGAHSLLCIPTQGAPPPSVGNHK